MKLINFFNKRNIITLIMIVFCAFTLTSCGNKYGKTTAYLEANSSGGCTSGTSTTKTDWLIEQINKNVDETLSETERLFGTNDDSDDQHTYIENLKSLIISYVNERAVANTDNESKINDNFKVCLLRNDIAKFISYLDNVKTANVDSLGDYKSVLNGSVGCLDVKSGQSMASILSKASEVEDVYLLGALFMYQVDQRLTELEPVKFKARTAGEFFANFWNNIFIFPLAWLLFIISKICGGYYIIGLIIATILVRTLGWPIYAKTNDMSLKMAEMQPELTKIQERYAGKNDPDSQRRMQMEQAQLYKKYKIGIGGCLAPILQFPIFMAIYRAISRLPYTKVIDGSIYNLNWANELNSNLFGVDLFADRSGGGTIQLIGILILIVLVVGTQILSQVLTQIRQKKNQQKSQENIPEYRRKAYNQQQNSAQSQMKFMLWFMILMMGMFVWQSKAGLGVYWLIGNLYSMVQMEINNVTLNRKKEKVRQENGVFTIKPDKK